MQLPIIFIWGMFALTFFLLGCFHWKMSGNRISHFKMSERPMTQMTGVQVRIQMAGADVDQPLRDFTHDFNFYLDNYNKSSSRQHKVQAIGYWVASATAVFSFVLTML